MVARILDRELEQQLIAQRQASGADRYDEVWNGEYVMSPLANNEHQQLAGKLTAIFTQLFGSSDDVWCLPGANVSDQEIAWTKNYRCPDVVVVLPGSRAVNRHTHWLGGPDLIVEITSEGDASRDKFDFYGRIGVREALIIDRDNECVELYRLEATSLQLTGRISADSTGILFSEVLGADISFISPATQPRLQFCHRKTGQKWRT